jgi:hypothetical protein
VQDAVCQSFFVSAHDTPETRDEPARPRILRKPVDDQALLDAVAWALSTRSDNPPPSRMLP